MQLGAALNKPASVRSYETSDSLPLPTCLIGLEVEVENAGAPLNRDHPLFQFWKLTRDDSLRGESAEFILSEPLFGEDLLSAIQTICDTGPVKEWEINYRTSLHVHLDARDLSFDAFKALCCTYAVIEPALYDWIGDKRDESIFCLPWYEAEGDIELIKQLFTMRDSSLARRTELVNRYSGLNLNSLSRFGSVEFRHMRTTFNYERIYQWVSMVQKLKYYATTIENERNLGTYLLDLFSQAGPEDFLREVFGPELANHLLDSAKNLDFYPGVLLAQDLLRDDIVKSMGVVFSPPNSFLVPGENEYVKKWEEKNQPKKPQRNIGNKLPLGTIHDEVEDDESATYAHGFVPDVDNERGVFLAWDFNRDQSHRFNGETIRYHVYIPPEDLGPVMAENVHHRLSRAWREMATMDMYPTITNDSIVQLHRVELDEEYESPWD